MVSSNFVDPLAKRVLLMTNILSTVRIDQLVVPEIVASDSGSAVLECMYSGAGNNVTVLWLLNGSQVYQWSEGTQPRASGLLEGKIDFSHKLSSLHPTQRRLLRMIEIIPEMSGEYTCVVQSRGQQARLSKTMIVFSPEHEFELTFSKATHQNLISFKCIAKHLYPQPDLTIEYNKIPISQQQQRIWRHGSFYNAECTAVLSHTNVGLGRGEVSCRLQLPLVDYTAITKKFINDGKQNSGSPKLPTSLFLLDIPTLVLVIYCN